MVPSFFSLQLQKQIIVWLWLWLMMMVSSISSSCIKKGPSMARSGCQECCGDVIIPYPFGIGPGCFGNASYEIKCENNTPLLLLPNNTPLEVISVGMYEHTVTVGRRASSMCGGDEEQRTVDLRGTPYWVGANVLMVEGCLGSVVLKDKKRERILAGCSSFCAINSTTNADAEIKLTKLCRGVECCLAPADMISVEGGDFLELALDRTGASSSDPCTLVAAFVDKNSVQNFTGKLSQTPTIPMVFQWSGNFSCQSYEYESCGCGRLYEGNPYLPNGCQVVQGCQKCKHKLNNCESTYGGDDQYHYYCVNPLLKLGSILGFSIGMGLVILILFCYWLYKVIKRKREVKRKSNYFKRNGGLLLQQRTSSSFGVFETTKILKATELEKATNNFNKNRILGQGGQGTVYKGMLSDGKIVAVKKSKQVDEDQLEHFVNELVILSQINHRNVVKILGCCLETKVPLLIYEFIPNGTLYQLIHASADEFHLSWKMRLQIAAESANALAYLHSSSATPIYHRDVKSSNILLDEKYRAKVSDFGTSRVITVEQTHLTTCVMGTYGYLDPEYFRSNQFTEKSDVYSFGVVLVELITSKKPIRPTKDGGWISLASEFLVHMEISRLIEFLDARLLDEGKEKEFINVANLAKQCLNMSGKLRPSMKEIAVVLDGIKSYKVPDSEEPHSRMAKPMHHAPIRTNTFSLQKGNSSSIDVQPLMPCTF